MMTFPLLIDNHHGSIRGRVVASVCARCLRAGEYRVSFVVYPVTHFFDINRREVSFQGKTQRLTMLLIQFDYGSSK
jgi:hypothetical protein